MTQPAPPSVPADAATSLATHLEQQRQRIDHCLEQLVPAETTPPSSIHRAMRYSLFACGKRLRPILCLETSRMLSRQPHSDIEAIASIPELIYTITFLQSILTTTTYH